MTSPKNPQTGQQTAPQTSDAASLTDKTKQAASDAASQAKDAAQSVASDAAQAAKTHADAARSSAADEASGIASALRTAADEMRSGSPQERTLGQIAEGFADASEAIRDKDMGTMVRDVTDFARHNPLVFLGGAALLGFAATRFARASGGAASATRQPRSQPPVQQTSPYDYSGGDLT